MTAPPQMNGNGGPPALPDGTMMVDPAMVTNALLNAIQQAAQGASASQSAAEAKDFMDAALKGAQAVVVLDPSLSQGGTPLDHDIALRTIDGQTQATVAEIQRAAQVETEGVRGEFSLRAAKERAAAPTPSRSGAAKAP